jgi:hypothetical protein
MSVIDWNSDNPKPSSERITHARHTVTHVADTTSLYASQE